MFRPRHDFEHVEGIDGESGSVPALLKLASAQEATLAEAIFQPVVGNWTTTDVRRKIVVENSSAVSSMTTTSQALLAKSIRSPLAENTHSTRRRPVRVRHEEFHDSGQGHGGWTIDPDAPMIMHYRIYLVPRSGATLFVTNRFHSANSVVESDFAYSDLTLHGADYPTGAYIKGRSPSHYSLREWIEDGSH